MSFIETLETISTNKQARSNESEATNKAFVALKEKRLKELKERELLLINEVSKTLCPTLADLNQVFYKGKGKIILTPLSAEKAPLGLPSRFLTDYSPYLYKQEEVRVEAQIDLFPPNKKDWVCSLNVWEKTSRDSHDLRVSFKNSFGQETSEFFDFRKEDEILKIEAYIARQVKTNSNF